MTSKKTIGFCIECKFSQILFLEGDPPKPEDRLCPLCNNHLWYLDFDGGNILELTEYDECGIYGSKEYLKKLFERTIEIISKE